MDAEKLKQLQTIVNSAEGLQKKMAVLDDVIACCNAEVGFLRIEINYRQQNEIDMANRFTPKELFEVFAPVIQMAAVEYKATLAEQFVELK